MRKVPQVFFQPPSSVFFTLHWGSLSKLGCDVFGTLWALIINVISYVSVNLTHHAGPETMLMKRVNVCCRSFMLPKVARCIIYQLFSVSKSISKKEADSVLWNNYNDLKICSGVLLHNWGLPRNLTGLPRDHKKWEPIVSQLLAICCRFKTLRSSALYDTFFDREEDFFYF